MNHLKRFYTVALVFQFLLLCGAVSVRAQAPALRLPRPSQKASVMQTIGVTDVTITYSRPAVKGRKIWGDAPAAVAAGSATPDDSMKRLKTSPLVPFLHVVRHGPHHAHP